MHQFFIFFQIFYYIISEDRLVFLYTHFRHGARAPLNLDDNFKDVLHQYWTNPGELTGVGQRMHYLLGLRNRLKYIKNQKFLSEKFDAHEILIYSTNYNRTMVSCSSHLQGLYPQKDLKGEILTDEQKEMAYPQVNVSYDEIKREIENLKDNSLPNNMILAPVRMVNDNENKLGIYDSDYCKQTKANIRKQNRENISIIINETKNFNEKYGEKLNNFLKTENKNYSWTEISDFCDSFLSSYTEKKNLTEFKTTGIDFKEMEDYCWKYYRYKYFYEIHGDDEKILAHIQSSKMLKELIYYMKRRLDADISTEDEDANLKDYSRPKFLMISGHDSTVAADEILIIRAFNLSGEKVFIYPRYASQMALEVKTSKEKATDYSDYYVVGYFDDKEIFNISAHEFMDKIEKEVWDDEKVLKACGVNSTERKSNDNEANSTENINNNYNYYNRNHSDKAKNAYKVLMIIFICLSAILLASTIYFAYKSSKNNNSLPPNYKNSSNSNNLSTINGLK